MSNLISPSGDGSWSSDRAPAMSENSADLAEVSSGAGTVAIDAVPLQSAGPSGASSEGPTDVALEADDSGEESLGGPGEPFIPNQIQSRITKRALGWI